MKRSYGLHQAQARIESELRDIADYFDFLHRMLAYEEVEDERRRIEALESLYGDDIPTGADIEHAFETDGQDPREPGIPYSPFRSTFARATNYSYIMLVCLIFEGECQNLLGEIARWKGVEPVAIRQGVVSGARRFVEEMLGPASIIDTAWDDLEKLMHVRNCIAHVGGIVELDPKPRRRELVESYAQSVAGLATDTWLRHGEPMLVVEEEYCRSAVNTIDAVFKGIFDAIDVIATDDASP